MHQAATATANGAVKDTDTASVQRRAPKAVSSDVGHRSSVFDRLSNPKGFPVQYQQKYKPLQPAATPLHAAGTQSSPLQPAERNASPLKSTTAPVSATASAVFDRLTNPRAYPKRHRIRFAQGEEKRHGSDPAASRLGTCLANGIAKERRKNCPLWHCTGIVARNCRTAQINYAFVLFRLASDLLKQPKAANLIDFDA